MLVAFGHLAKLVTNGQVTNYQLYMQLFTWPSGRSPDSDHLKLVKWPTANSSQFLLVILGYLTNES